MPRGRMVPDSAAPGERDRQRRPPAFRADRSPPYTHPVTERGRQPLDGHGTIAPAAFPVSPPPPDDAPEPEAVAWLDELEDVMETLGAALAEAQWALYTSGSGEALGRLGGARAAFYGDPAVTAALGAWRTRALAPQTARRVELLCREFELEQVRAEREIARAVGDMVELQAHQRAHLHGKVVSDDVLVGLLRSSPDPSEREAAWRARASLGEHLAPRLRSLAAMRNRAAQRLGWSSYWELGLAAAEMEEATLGPLLESMERATRAPGEAPLERGRTLMIAGQLAGVPRKRGLRDYGIWATRRTVGRRPWGCGSPARSW